MDKKALAWGGRGAVATLEDILVDIVRCGIYHSCQARDGVFHPALHLGGKSARAEKRPDNRQMGDHINREGEKALRLLQYHQETD
jgi:hypothetical protein